MSKALSRKRKHSSIRRTTRRGADRFTVIPPEGEAYHGCLLTLYEADSHSGARVIDQPPPGALGAQEIMVEWWHGLADTVIYQLEAFTRPVDPPPDAPSPTRQSTGFLPRQHGFRFANAFPSVPDITIPIPFGRIEFGDASDGLCGGMVFCALDYFLADHPIPPIASPSLLSFTSTTSSAPRPPSRKACDRYPFIEKISSFAKKSSRQHPHGDRSSSDACVTSSMLRPWPQRAVSSLQDQDSS